MKDHLALPFSAAAFGAFVLCAFPAVADVGFELRINETSPMFHDCGFDILIDAPKAFANVVLAYEIVIKGKGTLNCRTQYGPDRSFDTSCDGAEKTPFTCESAFSVHPTGVACYNAANASVPCGAVSLTTPRPGLFEFKN